MAQLSGKVTADFDDYNEAVDSAVSSLDGLLQESTKVEAGLSTMTGTVESDLHALTAQTTQTTTAIAGMGTTSTTTAGSVNTLQGAYRQFDGALAAGGIHIGPAVKGIEDIAGAAGKTTAELGLLTTAGLVVGTAMAAWKVGRQVAEFFDLDKAIANTTARLLGWGDVVEQTAGAKADVLARATRNAGREITDYGEALRINTQAQKDHLKQVKDDAKGLEEWKKSNEAVTIASQDYKVVLETINGATVEAAKYALAHGASQKDVATSLGMTAAQAAAVASALDVERAATQRQEKADRDWKDAVDELNAVGNTQQETLDKIDGTVVEGIKHYLDMGVSQKAIVTLYGQQEVAVRAVAKARDEDIAAAKRQQEAEDKLQQTLEKQSAALIDVRRDYETAVTKSSHDTMQAEIDNAWAAAQAKIDSMDKAKTLTVEAYDLIWQTADQTTQNIVNRRLEDDTSTRAHYQLLADKAKEAYDFALANSNNYTDKDIENRRKQSEAAQKALDNWGAQAEAGSQKEYQAKVKALDATIAATQAAFDATVAQGDSYSKTRIVQIQTERTAAIAAAQDFKFNYVQALLDVANETDQVIDKVKGLHDLFQKQPERTAFGLTQAAGALFPTSESLARASLAPGSMLGVGTPSVPMSMPFLSGQPWNPAAQFYMPPVSVTMNYPIVNDPQAMDQLGRLVGDAVMSRVTRAGTLV